MPRTADDVPRARLSRLLIGRPLPTADAPHQTINKVVGLAVFASDALSSTAYGPQEMLLILALAGSAAFGFAMPVMLAIVALLLILTISYRQTIQAYPGGGGAYIVARDNLGELPAQAAGAALLTDYALTVAVSIASGVAQLVSAFPELLAYRTLLAVLMVLFVMMVNLRGVRESGAIFAVPTYFFLLMMLITLAIGFGRLLAGGLGGVVEPPAPEHLYGTQAISLFLILRAFAGGTTALTGVEAISNGITAFREPRSRNASTTLVWMSLVLGSLLLGITYLATVVGAVPSEEETVISQLARTVFAGRGLAYLLAIASTTVILIMAANTAFADFPRLGALQAGDGFLPRQLTFRGSRLVYSRGIVVLAAIACALLFAFDSSVTGLIPLYAIGVFLSFTLSQLGMARRWWKSGHLAPGAEIQERGSTLRYEPGWMRKMVVNAFGALCTAVVMLIFGATKFHDGAWVVIVLVPALVTVFFAIHRHYRGLARQLSLDSFGASPHPGRHRIIMPVGGVHQGTLAALRYARSLGSDVTAVHVAIDPQEAERISQKWDLWGEGVRLVILDSPYRVMLDPLVQYIKERCAERTASEAITVVVPQFVPQHARFKFLHMDTANAIRSALLRTPGLVVVDVPYQVT